MYQPAQLILHISVMILIMSQQSDIKAFDIDVDITDKVVIIVDDVYILVVQ